MIFNVLLEGPSGWNMQEMTICIILISKSILGLIGVPTKMYIYQFF